MSCTFDILDSSGTLYTVPVTILDTNAVSYDVGIDVLGADGTTYTVGECPAAIVSGSWLLIRRRRRTS